MALYAYKTAQPDWFVYYDSKAMFECALCKRKFQTGQKIKYLLWKKEMDNGKIEILTYRRETLYKNYKGPCPKCEHGHLEFLGWPVYVRNKTMSKTVGLIYTKTLKGRQRAIDSRVRRITRTSSVRNLFKAHEE